MPEWRFRCPYGHASITLGAHRFSCQACYAAGREPNYDKDDLVDLEAGEEPPHA